MEGGSDTPQAGSLEAGALGLVGAATMGAVMMSPALAIYFNLGPIVESAGTSAPFVFIVALFVSLPTAASYALISRQLPSSGSAYTWLWQATWPFVGIWVGWMLVAYYSIAVVLQPLLFCISFNTLLEKAGVSPSYATFALGLAASAVLVACVTYRGIQLSARAAVALLLVEMAVVAGLAATALAAVGAGRGLALSPFLPPAPPSAGGILSPGLFAALIFGVLSFTGFDVVSTVAEETRTARRFIPAATLLSCVAVGLYWALTSWGYSIAVPVERILEDKARGVVPILSIAKEYWPFGDVLIIATSITAALGVFIATVVGSSRVLYAMARDGTCPKALAVVHARFRTPWRSLHLVFLLAIVATALPVAAFPIYDVYEWWGKAFVFFALTIYVLVNLANTIYFLRFRRDRFNPLTNGLLPAFGALVDLYLIYRCFLVECWSGDFASGKSVIIFVLACMAAAGLHAALRRGAPPGACQGRNRNA